MEHPLLRVYTQALQVIVDAGGIEGEALKPIACPFDPAVPADRLGLAMVAAALHERRRRGYAAEWMVERPERRGAYEAIAFPDGVRSMEALGVREDSFALLTLKREVATRDPLAFAYGAFIADALDSEVAEQPLDYAITELTANVWDHAETDTAFVLAGADERSLVLTVVDAGISIPFSYARRDIRFDSDIAALAAALEGKSARPQGGRGYGLRTTVKLAVEGWGGRCFLASHHATVLQSRDGRDARDTSPFHWNGTIVALELPLPLRSVDLYAYVEG